MYVLGVFLLEGTNQPQMIKCSRYELDTIEQNRGLEKGCHCVWFVFVCVCFLLALKSSCEYTISVYISFYLIMSWMERLSCSFVCLFFHFFNYFFPPAVLSVLRKLKQQAREALEERRPSLIQALKDIGDFYLELKWDFHSWGTCTCVSHLAWVFTHVSVT